MYVVPRAGQDGYHHRTEVNKKAYQFGNGSEKNSGATETDLNKRAITPMGGSSHCEYLSRCMRSWRAGEEECLFEIF